MATIEALATRIGGLSWVSGELFALEGRWAAEMDSPVAVIHLATHSRHHGWHASLWEQALPDSGSLDTRSTIVAPPGWASALETIAGLDSSEVPDVAPLAMLYRGLIPRLAALLADLGDDLGGPGDTAIERTLGFVWADVTADLIGGLRVLTAVLGEPGAGEIAAQTTKTLDQAFRT
jgi:hypothetical protein